jgi:5-methylthioribose kinase
MNRNGKMKPEDKTDLLFVKYADEVLSGMNGKTLLSKGARVKPEYHGYQELARQMQNMVPRTYVADEVEGLLITEFLTDHRAFADFLKKGEVPAVVGEDSVPVQIAQLLGRYHGHSMENSEYETEEYKQVFENQEQIDFWLARFVDPLLNTLRDPVAHITKPYLAQSLAEVLEEGEEDAAALLWAVDSLRRSYEFKKQALVHADTHAQNVLVSEKDGGVKLIDAEKSMWGPCGFDMGQWLANFAYYLAAFEGDGERAQRLCDCMQFSWLHYERVCLCFRCFCVFVCLCVYGCVYLFALCLYA